MHPLTLPDGRSRTLPTRWGEVTLGQSARLAELPDAADRYSLLSVLLDLSPIEVMNLPTTLVHEQVLPALEFATSGEMPTGGVPPRSLYLPGVGAFAGRRFPVDLDLTNITFGQATDLGDVLQDTTLSVHERRQQLLAICFYAAYHDAPYDSDGIEEFALEVCSQAYLEEALPLTDFFLLSSTASGAPTPASSSASPSPSTSARPDSKSWWKNGMRWLWSTRWPLATKRSGASSGARPGAK